MEPTEISRDNLPENPASDSPDSSRSIAVRETYTASELLTEKGELQLDFDTTDWGFKKLLESEKNCVVMADGKVVKLTGSDDDIVAVSQDFNYRTKLMALQAYTSGINIIRLRDYLIEAYSFTPKQFWDKVTNLTGLSRASLENRIKMAEGFTAKEIQTLTDAGITQTTALRALKATPEKKAELVELAESGMQISATVADEVLGKGEDFEEEEDEKPQKLPGKSESGSKTKKNPSAATLDLEIGVPDSSETPKTDKSVPSPAASPALPTKLEDGYFETAGSFKSYTDLSPELNDYKTENIALSKRLENLVKEIEASRTKHEVGTVRGSTLRIEMARVLAAYHGISLPKEIESKDEPKWVQELREKYGKIIGKPVFNMALTEGHLGAMRREESAPADYEKMIAGKIVSKENVEVLYDLWSIGFAQRKKAMEETEND